jgi:phosphoribosylformylglycinamidine cyclo-ligase
VAGIVHVTGGGIPGNIFRIFPDKNLGAYLPDLHSPHPIVLDLQKLGNIDEKECYRTWHCGTAMMLFVDKQEAKKICEVLNRVDKECEAKIVGEVTSQKGLKLVSKFSGKTLLF